MCPKDFPGGSDGKASAYNAGDPGSIPALGRSPGEGNGNPLQYFCLENPMDRGAWQATVQRVTQSRTRPKWLSTHACSLLWLLCSQWSPLAWVLFLALSLGLHILISSWMTSVSLHLYNRRISPFILDADVRRILQRRLDCFVCYFEWLMGFFSMVHYVVLAYTDAHLLLFSPLVQPLSIFCSLI